MRIGIPRETKTLEGRVALVPAACADLVRRGHEVWIEKDAGIKSGFSDDEYTALGVRIAADAAALYEKAELVVKVKEPIEGDLKHLRKDHLLFCYLHLAAEPVLTRKLLDIGLTGVAFETVELDNGDLPLLTPMSIVAGRIAVQVGAHYLHQPMGGKGKLLGGLPSTERGKVVVLGAGAAGGNSAALAASSGANVVVFEKRQDRMAQMMALGPNVTALYPTRTPSPANCATPAATTSCRTRRPAWCSACRARRSPPARRTKCFRCNASPRRCWSGCAALKAGKTIARR